MSSGQKSIHKIYGYMFFVLALKKVDDKYNDSKIDVEHCLQRNRCIQFSQIVKLSKTDRYSIRFAED